MKKIIVPDTQEIIEINALLGYKLIDKGKLVFIMDKLKSKLGKKELKKDLASRASVLWYDIITQHPFLDGNKRTAVEAVKLFLTLNGYELNIPYNGIIYISLRIANHDISLKELEEIIYKNLRKVSGNENKSDS